jgi:hypothetical protein
MSVISQSTKKCWTEIQSKQNLIVFEDLKEVITENWRDSNVEKWPWKNKLKTYLQKSVKHRS